MSVTQDMFQAWQAEYRRHQQGKRHILFGGEVRHDPDPAGR